jgi:hypothetical protein
MHVPRGTIRYGWTLEYNEWERLRSALASRVWNRARLESVYRESVPQRSGVYLICGSPCATHREPFKYLYGVVYAGQASSLRRRFVEHCSRPKSEIAAAKECMHLRRLDYWFCEAASEDLSYFETVMIQTLGPPANLIEAPRIKGKVGQPLPAGQA